MKIKILSLILISLILISGGWYVYSRSAKKVDSSKPTKIGIIYKGAGFQKVVDGFEAGMRESVDVESHPFVLIKKAVQGDTQTDFDAVTAEVIADGADVLFVVAIEPMIAAQKMTRENNVPVVFAFGGDPVETDFVKSLRSSENNFTGVTWLAWGLSGKRLEILKEMIPTIKKVTAITRTKSKAAEISFRSIDAVSDPLGIAVSRKEVSTVAEMKLAISGIASDNADAIYYVPDPFILRNADLLIRASLEKKLPIIFHEGKFAYDGALAGYGPKFFDAGKQASRLMKKIVFDGVHPTDIPSEAATSFEFVINQKTADALGISISPGLLSRADKVIR